MEVQSHSLFSIFIFLYVQRLGWWWAEIEEARKYDLLEEGEVIPNLLFLVLHLFDSVVSQLRL